MIIFFVSDNTRRVPGFGSLITKVQWFDSYDRNHEAYVDRESMVLQDVTACMISFVSYKSTQFGVSCLHNTREKYNLFENKTHFFLQSTLIRGMRVHYKMKKNL